MDVKVGVRIRPTFKFYAAVAVYSRRASHWLSINQYSCLYLISYRIPFNFSNFRRQLEFNKQFLQKNGGTNLTTRYNNDLVANQIHFWKENENMLP